jgi:hypothetical protein
MREKLSHCDSKIVRKCLIGDFEANQLAPMFQNG